MAEFRSSVEVSYVRDAARIAYRDRIIELHPDCDIYIDLTDQLERNAGTVKHLMRFFQYPSTKKIHNGDYRGFLAEVLMSRTDTVKPDLPAPRTCIDESVHTIQVVNGRMVFVATQKGLDGDEQEDEDAEAVSDSDFDDDFDTDSTGSVQDGSNSDYNQGGPIKNRANNAKHSLGRSQSKALTAPSVSQAMVSLSKKRVPSAKSDADIMRCPLQDVTNCKLRITSSKRPTHVIKHIKEYHKVPLEQKMGGNIDVQRNEQRKVYLEWCRQQGYPEDDSWWRELAELFRARRK